MTDRMTVAEARKVLARSGYAFKQGRPARTSLSAYDVRDMENITLHMLFVDEGFISRASVNELVERAKK